MEDRREARTVSRHEMHVWIPGCPVQIKEVALISDGAELYVKISLNRCTDQMIVHIIGDVVYYDSRRELVGISKGIKFEDGESFNAEYRDAAYAEVTVQSVMYSDGSKWVNESSSDGEKLPEQQVIWQTDPLYKIIKKVTQGVVNAGYYPDEVNGGWRCACGGVNISRSKNCGLCGCSRSWLTESFDRDYLESQKSAVEEGKKIESAQKIKKREAEKLISDKTKFILILTFAALVVLLILLTVLVFIPGSNYSKANKLASAGQYDEAIIILNGLGDYKDSVDLVTKYTHDKFAQLTGEDQIYITTTEAEPWFEIEEDGTLEFISTKYTGDWGEFRIPEVVNGVIVTSLAKNFCINCSELTEVVIPNTVTKIGDQAFLNCEALTKIEFGSAVMEIDQRAFIDCMSLEEIIIPDTVLTLGQRAFNNCKELRSVTLGCGITEIMSYTFSNCRSLETLVLKSPITLVGEQAFVGCGSLTTVVCDFPEEDWVEPVIADGNENWKNIKIEFNS